MCSASPIALGDSVMPEWEEKQTKQKQLRTIFVHPAGLSVEHCKFEENIELWI